MEHEVASLQPAHNVEIRRLEAKHLACVDFWAFQVIQGYNLAFYGYGDKQNLLDALMSKPVLRDRYHMVCVGGSDSQLSLYKMVELVCACLGVSRIQLDEMHFVPARPVLFLVHNLDGPHIRDKRFRSALKDFLEKFTLFQIVCSINRVTTGHAWWMPQSRSWLFHHTPTFRLYATKTTRFGVDPCGSENQSCSVVAILNNLSMNTRKLYLMLATQLLQDSRISFYQFYQKARQELLASSETVLRTLLKELFDHKILDSKTVRGVEWLHLPFDAELAKQIISNLANQELP